MACHRRLHGIWEYVNDCKPKILKLLEIFKYILTETSNVVMPYILFLANIIKIKSLSIIMKMIIINYCTAY